MPDVALDLVALLGGLAALTVGADRFVLGAARLSVLAALSPVVVGAVVIGFGTSLPELAVSGLAVAQDTSDLALGNVAGSNTANVLLVLGGAAAVRAMGVRGATLRREVPIMLAGVALFVGLAIDGEVSVVDGVVLLAGGVLAFGVLVRAAMVDRAAAAVLAPEVEEYAGERPRALPAALLTVLGMAAVLAGAHFVVQGATGLARAAGVSDVVIGVTVVAVGTSLPELVTAAAAARRGETDLVIGNVLGSNLFNSLGVAGVAGLIGTVPLSPSFGPNALVMLGACALAAVLLGTGRVLSRPEGAVLLVLFAGAIATAVALG